MKKQILYFIILLMIVLFTGCAAMFVPSTNDPNQKIKDAIDLFETQGRPLPAERLIQEAMYIFQKENDSKGLAKAYWAYGLFFSSNAVTDMKAAYEEHGFLDKSVKFYDRYDKAFEYLNKAESIAEKQNDYNFLSNISYCKAQNYRTTGDTANACKSFQSSLGWNLKAHNIDPEMKFFIPGMGYLDFEKYSSFFTEFMKKVGCQ